MAVERADVLVVGGGIIGLATAYQLLRRKPGGRLALIERERTLDARSLVCGASSTPLAMARTGYRRRDLSVPDLAATLTYPGFLRLAARYVRTGAAEMWRDVSKRSFLRALQRYIPELRGDQIQFGPSGVRAQALDRDGTLVDDFRLGGEARVLHVGNAPSPGATSSPAIGRTLADAALERFAAA